MSMSRRQFTKEYKEAAVRRLKRGGSLAEVARACEVNPDVLYRWKRERHEHGVRAFAGSGKVRAEESRVAELERKVGRQAMENDFWRRCLLYAEEQRRLQALTTRGSSTRTSRTKSAWLRWFPCSGCVCLARSAGLASTAGGTRRRRKTPTWICATRSSGSRWNGPALVGVVCGSSCGGGVGR
jgi:transposase